VGARLVGGATPMSRPAMDKALRLAFLDELAKHIGHVERRTARERTVHRWGYGPVVVWSASSGTGTALVMPYSSGSGVVRVHLNRYSAESRLLGWTAEITCMPDELVGLAEWLATFIRVQSMGQVAITLPEIFSQPGPVVFIDTRNHYLGIWTWRARAHEKEHALNVRPPGPVKETR